MTLIRAIAPDYLTDQKKVVEGEFTDNEIKDLNSKGYNIYYLPNSPSVYNPDVIVDGSHIDKFEWVFVDFDLKQGQFESKEAFIHNLAQFLLEPSKVVDSGGGIHSYWRVVDLDAMSFLRLQRRLCRALNTDEAVCKIYQLMRLPGTNNTKILGNPRPCELLLETENQYTCEQLDQILPIITQKDEQYCQDHYNKTKNINNFDLKVDDNIPLKFKQLLANNAEVKQIWSGGLDDRSVGDYRLAHIMLANGFSREEAMSTLVNCAKALQRTPTHRIGYAKGIVDKLWTEDPQSVFKRLSVPVKNILTQDKEVLKGTRFPSHKYLDNTEHGFRLGHVIGLAGGTGIGKTAIVLNAVLGFAASNPDYVHFFVSLEQSQGEIAARWDEICGGNQHLNGILEIIENHDEDGTFRDLSLKDISDYIAQYKKITGKKVGCVTIDHIGILSQRDVKTKGEFEGLKQIARQLKPFAISNDVLVIALTQVPRDKAGIGDIELDVNAAYGTGVFEHMMDFLITVWQPLKRVYKQGAPTITSIKFCKIRHKQVKKDVIQENVRYNLYFDPDTQRLGSMTQDLETSFKFYNQMAVNERKKDKKTDVLEYESVRWA